MKEIETSKPNQDHDRLHRVGNLGVGGAER